ncbi:MAG: T9SS type A sorting domain-containing protein [Bacteroidetes bacterium]|nr:T9SS type A sorting domain-containing protein [Bacteroidota bacterium]
MRKFIIIIFLLASVPSFAQWTKISGLSGGRVSKVIKTSHYLFAVTDGNGLFRSSDNGLDWEESNNGFSIINILDITEIGTDIYAASYGKGIFRSTDFGSSWSSFSPALITPFANCVSSINGKLLVGTYIGIFILQGNQWVDITSGLNYPNISEIKKYNNILYVKLTGVLYKSTNEGQSWSRIGHSSYTDYADYCFKDNYIYALDFNGIYKCHLDSTHWVTLPKPYPSAYYPITIFSDSLNLFVSYQNFIYKSTNSGLNFTPSTSPITNNIYPRYSSCSDGNNIFLANTNGIMYSSDGGSTWQSRNKNIINILFNSVNIYGSELYCTIYGIIYKTTTNGDQWTLNFDGYANNGYYPANSLIKKNSSRIFIPVSNSYYTILRTSNGGVNWFNGLQSYSYSTYLGEINNEDILFLSDNYLLVYHDDNTLNFSTFYLNSVLNHIYKSGNEFFISSQSDGIYKCSSSYILTQINNGLTNLNSNAVTSAGDFLFAATNSGIYRTNRNSINWTKVFQEQYSSPFTKIISYNNYIFANSGTAVYKSSDFGNTWISIYSAAANINVNNIWNNSEYIFASIGNAGLIRRSISDAIGISPISSRIPDKFSLSQNYPNPFNPNTTINFQIPKNNFVNLKVYDINGREVSELVNENLNAGEYKINFNATALPSGVYYYKLTSDNFSETKKMMLIK